MDVGRFSIDFAIGDDVKATLPVLFEVVDAERERRLLSLLNASAAA